jgi:hypothetical protein
LPAGEVTVHFKEPTKTSVKTSTMTSDYKSKVGGGVAGGDAVPSGPVTENIPEKYLNPSTSKLNYQVQAQGVTKLEIKLEK